MLKVVLVVLGFMCILVGFVSFQTIKMSSVDINNNNNNDNNMCGMIMWVFGCFIK